MLNSQIFTQMSEFLDHQQVPSDYYDDHLQLNELTSLILMLQSPLNCMLSLYWAVSVTVKASQRCYITELNSAEVGERKEKNI